MYRLYVLSKTLPGAMRMYEIPSCSPARRRVVTRTTMLQRSGWVSGRHIQNRDWRPWSTRVVSTRQSAVHARTSVTARLPRWHGESRTILSSKKPLCDSGEARVVLYNARFSPTLTENTSQSLVEHTYSTATLTCFNHHAKQKPSRGVTVDHSQRS